MTNQLLTVQTLTDDQREIISQVGGCTEQEFCDAFNLNVHQRSPKDRWSVQAPKRALGIGIGLGFRKVETEPFEPGGSMRSSSGELLRIGVLSTGPDGDGGLTAPPRADVPPLVAAVDRDPMAPLPVNAKAPAVPAELTAADRAWCTKLGLSEKSYGEAKGIMAARK